MTKVCDPLDDRGLFNLLLTPAGGTPAPIPGGTDVACTNPPQSRGPFELDPGTYTVSESAGTDTNLADYVQPRTFSGNCAPAGVVMLALNDSKTCTITNVRLGEPAGFLTVEKICDPTGDSGRFEIPGRPNGRVGWVRRQHWEPCTSRTGSSWSTVSGFA